MTRSGGLTTVSLLAALWALTLVSPPLAGQGQRGTAMLSGSVTADHGTVVAFRVKATDTLHKISYTVFSQRGRYTFHALPASHYEVAVLEDGYESPVQRVDLVAGASATAHVTARWTNPVPTREPVEFDVLYPPAPARETIIRACFGCHGAGDGFGTAGGFHAHPPKDEQGWRNAVARMFTPGAMPYGNWGESRHVPYINDDVVSAAEREAIVKYFAANFGPGSKPRTLKLDPLVRDEAALSEAMYTQYELPPDHGIHDIFPSRAMPGWVWTSMTPGFIVGTDTRNPDPATRTKDYPIPDPVGRVASHGIIEEKGLVYWTEIAGNHIGELDPKTGTIRRYQVPSLGGWQHTLRADTKGNIWVSYMSGANKIAKLDTATKQVTEIPAIKSANSYGVIVDQKDRIWLSVVSNKAVPMYDSRTGRWAVYETANSTRRLTADSKGKIWAVQYFGNAVTQIDPDTGRVTDYKLPLKYGDPYDVIADPADTLWIENTMYNSLVRLDQKTKKFTYVPFPVLNGHTPKLESDDEGTIWFGLSRQLTSLEMRGNAPGKKASQSRLESDVKDNRDWTLTGGDLGNTRYSTLAQITTQNILQLGAAWVSKPFADRASSRSTPIVHDGLMFVTAGAQLYALNARTGDVVWAWRSDAKKVIDVAENLGLVESLQQGHGLPSPGGVAVGEGLVFLGLTDGHVVALREKTGELVWTRQTGEDPAPRGQSVSGAPIYARGLVFTGLANGDWSIRGRVVALDAKTGREVWHFFSVPGPGEVGHETWPRGSAIWQKGGAGVWFSGSADPDLGLVYFVTGNAVPYYGGEEREGDNLFAASAVALDMQTGTLRWHFQLVRHDIWEADIRSSPVLFDLDVKGQPRKAVALMRGDGYIFVLDRATGKPLQPIEDRPVMQDARLKTAKTQPYPVGGESILPTCQWWKDKVPPGFSFPPGECGFVPPFFDRFNIAAPQAGVRGSMAYSPDTRHLYLQGSSQLSTGHRVGTDPWILDRGENVLSLFTLPTVRVLAAVDTRTNKVVWRRDIQPIPLSPSAPLTTAGGLLFRGEVDGNLEAYNARTGDVLWRFQMGSTGARSAPSTFVLDGRQYIAIAAGQSVWTFTLGGTVPPREASTKPDLGNFYARPAKDEDADVVEMARLVPSMVLGSGRRYAIDEHSFQPLSARVKVGTRLRFVNNGNITHTLAARDGSWKTGQLAPGFDAYVTFGKPGAYIYECTEHPGVIGRVVVVP